MTDGELKKYETLGVIGRGGMATVFIGRARGAAGFSRLVAVKRAHDHVRGDAALAASMKHEATLAARLHHPNVVRVIDVVEEADDLVLVLDYVEGGSLAELLKLPGEAVFPDARTRARVIVRVLLDIAAGLDAAHRALDDDGEGLGIVHRDVSPSNVLVGTDGIARLTDFGIAKALEGGSELTETGVLKGKIAYMAPEYVEHQRADAAADQFSLGVVAWEGLTGKRLFRGPHEIETLKRVVMCQVPSLAEVAPAMAPLAPVLARVLSRAPRDRFASVRELAEALEAAARAADLVGSHGEVGAVVERALREDLTARRRLVRGLTDGDDESARSAAAAADARRGRDDIPTASVVSLAPSRSASAAPPPVSAVPSVAPDASIPPPALVAHHAHDAHDAGAAKAGAAKAARKRQSAVILAISIVMSLVGLSIVAWRVRVAAANAAAANAATIAAASEGAAAGSATLGDTSDPIDSIDPLDPAEPTGSSAAPRPSNRPARGRPGTGAGRRTAPSGGIVPRKAPPNPYVH